MLPLEVDEVARVIGGLGVMIAGAGLVWQVVQFRLSRARVKANAFCGVAQVGSSSVGPVDGAAVLVSVQNLGGAPVDLTAVVVQSRGGPWYDNPRGPRLPSRLEPGTRQVFVFPEPAAGLRDDPPSDEGLPQGPVRARAYFVGGMARSKWIRVQQFCD